MAEMAACKCVANCGGASGCCTKSVVDWFKIVLDISTCAKDWTPYALLIITSPACWRYLYKFYSSRSLAHSPHLPSSPGHVGAAYQAESIVPLASH